MSGHVLGTFGGPGGWPEGARALGIREVGIELDTAACATRRAAGHQTITSGAGAVFLNPVFNILGKPDLPHAEHSLRLGEIRARDDLLDALTTYAKACTDLSRAHQMMHDGNHSHHATCRLTRRQVFWKTSRVTSQPRRRSRTPEQKAAEAAKMRARRANLTPEQRQAIREADRVRDKERYATLTPGEREAKAERRRAVAARRTLTPEQRAAKLRRERERAAARAPEQRAAKLDRDRAREAERRANWTPEEREAAYAKHRERERNRRAAMSASERAIRTLRESARRFGFDPGLVEAHFRAHSGLCDICGRSPTEVGGKSNSRLSVDHDHQSGRFRGLLCPHCNYALGLMSDSPERLMEAAEYLLKGHIPLRAAS